VPMSSKTPPRRIATPSTNASTQPGMCEEWSTAHQRLPVARSLLPAMTRAHSWRRASIGSSPAARRAG
jgi:hypothetical protein